MAAPTASGVRWLSVSQCCTSGADRNEVIALSPAKPLQSHGIPVSLLTADFDAQCRQCGAGKWHLVLLVMNDDDD